jgi:hypothetical protein
MGYPAVVDFERALHLSEEHQALLLLTYRQNSPRFHPIRLNRSIGHIG